MAASAASITAVQKAYVAYYGRPADTAGLTYWSERLDSIEGEFSQMIEAFGSSDEATALFGSLENGAKINTIYQQIFGRDADAEGLEFYSAALTAGTMSAVTIAQNIIDGAANDDATIVANKLTAAQAFTDYLISSGNGNYDGNDAISIARDWLDDVTVESASVTSASASIATVVDSFEPVQANPGSTFTLTSADDEFTGTDKDDTFIGRSVHISADDQIDGGAGDDVFNVTVSGNVAAVEVDNVETINFNIASFTAPMIDLDNVGGGAINLNMSAAGYTRTVNFTNTDDLSVTISDSFQNVTLGGYDGGIVNVGAGMSSLALATTANEAVLNLSNTNTLTLRDASGLDDLTLTAVGTGTRVVDVNMSSSYTGDIVLEGAVRLMGNSSAFDDATIVGSADSVIRMDGAGATTVDLEDISVGEIQADVSGLTFTSANDKLISLITANSTLTVNANSDGGNLTVEVDADNSTLTLSAAGFERDEVDVTFTTNADTVTSFVVGALTNATVQDATTFTAITGSSDANLVIGGTGNVTITNVSQISTLDLTGLEGITTVAAYGSVAGGLQITTGDSADVMVMNATASATLATGAGNDVINASAMGNGANVYVAAGEGNDVFVMAGTNFTSSNTGTIVFAGGNGTDTLDLNLTASVNFTGLTLTLDSVEVMTHIGDFSADASTFNGKTMAISATGAVGEDFTLTTGATDRTLDMSGLTFDSSVDSVIVNLATVVTSQGFTFTGSAKAESVAAASNVAFNGTYSMGSGNDVITFGGQLTAYAGATVSLGSGSDTVVFNGTGAGTRVGIHANSTALTDADDLTDIVTITDFTLGSHGLQFDSVGSSLSIASPVSVGASIALADIGTLTGQTTTTLWDDLSGYVSNGKLMLAGSDVANVNTVEEWVYAALLTISAATSSVVAFEFGGDTYLVAGNAGTASGELATVKLAGVTGATLGPDVGATVIEVD